MDQGGETDDKDLHLYDDSVIGVHGATPYNHSGDYPANAALIKLFREKYGPDAAPSFAGVFAYDGMQVLYEMIRSSEGKPFDGPAAIKAVLGYSWNSPRGPVKIDPEKRGLTQNYYIRKVDRIDGKLANVLVETYEGVSDPWPNLHPVQ
jgi:branched-chain amino acid transport system substrate-binding protein